MAIFANWPRTDRRTHKVIIYRALHRSTFRRVVQYCVNTSSYLELCILLELSLQVLLKQPTEMSGNLANILSCAFNEDSDQPAHPLRSIPHFFSKGRRILSVRWDHTIFNPNFEKVEGAYCFSLRKHDYSNIHVYWKFHHQKWKFPDKNSDIFLYSCSKHRLWVFVRVSTRGGSNECPQSVFEQK